MFCFDVVLMVVVLLGCKCFFVDAAVFGVISTVIVTLGDIIAVVIDVNFVEKKP